MKNIEKVIFSNLIYIMKWNILKGELSIWKCWVVQAMLKTKKSRYTILAELGWFIW